jgi:tetratricopeptide (TPR) repeat protein
MAIRSVRPACVLLLAACANPAPPPVAAPPSPPSALPKVPESVAKLAEGAALLAELGSHHHDVTAMPEAQTWFDQGLRLVYGFNHDEAARSFAKGATIDPSCAMCFWGVALALGPNYNMPMMPGAAQAAWDALSRARELAPRATPVEQALVAALGSRYKSAAPLDPVAMQPFTVAYANALRDVAAKFPADDDVQVLAAEAAMDVNPWKLWSDGKPAEGTPFIVATLERVLARSANHPGANHYYIHAVEASPNPEKALPSADRLAALMPGAGHIVHMPAHIYQRLGRYADASAQNERALAADRAYMKQVKPPGMYPMYFVHNYGFLAFSSSMEGRSKVSLDAARAAVKTAPPGVIDMMPGMDFFATEPVLAMVRFGKWDELLSEPKPEPKYPVLTAFWLHGHAMALAAKKRLAEAHADLAALQKMAGAAPDDLVVGQSPAKTVFALAAKIVEARLATLENNPKSLGLWDEAVKLGDTLAYSEPDERVLNVT